ncbi:MULTISPECIES: DinB family protein [Planktothricoides]|uniref:Damage-inducible protein DinB n=2 Tax=Planktothricoides raciborskii TaxID=132608 RepID=A0ABR8EHN4_9CYAN|nr:MULTISPECIES: DinB family protein [Planktothricoides]KOR36899.1 damage-inducible protein DinB [Planktothricoides sp. SR001]MBD2546203.1 damage-inducible protein DinB [Planktothricoides raciborskii FACHB-1370]MBD2584476.1 damage-inducible protein DinB [Planktothricoides raciborskii FACHB-1261]
MQTNQCITLIKHFQMLARYNTLANLRIYQACSQLSRAELTRFRPSFFGSIYATLNHILVCDRLWLARFASNTVKNYDLNAILYETFSELEKARIVEDGHIESFTQNMAEEFLQETIKYYDRDGKFQEYSAILLLEHFFHYQTHHRGQVHDMITQTEIIPPVLDLHRLLRPYAGMYLN